MAGFKIGLDAGDRVIVAINGRPDANDDWLAATVSIRVGSFSGLFDALLVTCDFPLFRRQLEKLYESLVGSATFDTIEGQLRIQCTGNGRGGITIDGMAQDRVGDGNELQFRFEIDQTFLRAIIKDIQTIESDFPNKKHIAALQ
jgi:hypothetical protein